MTKKFVLCADDYGQSDAISRGILDLISKQRLSATSCLTTAPYWSTHAKWLLPYKEHVDIGLHFNLTEGNHDQAMPLAKLLAAAYTGCLSREKIITELNRQLDCFVEAFGQWPDFIDGHQHIQQLPIIRNAILTVYNSRLRNYLPYVRYVGMQTQWTLKKFIIHLLGSKVFRRDLERHSIPHNQSFAGVYNFADAARYAEIFPKFLAEIQQGGLIMCHPGQSDDDVNDKIAYGRQYEYQYFLSEEFITACKQANVEITRFCHLGSGALLTSI